MQRIITAIKKISQDPKYFLLWLVVAVYPLLVIPGPLNYYTGGRYLGLAFIALAAAYYVLLKGRYKRHPAYIPLGLFAVISLLAALAADDLFKSFVGRIHRFMGLSTYLFCIVLFLLALLCRRQEGDKLIKCMVITAAVVSLTAVLQHFGINVVPLASYLNPVFPGGVVGTMGNGNWLGTYTVFILPGAVLAEKLLPRQAWLACVALIYAGLLVSMTRYAWLTFLVAAFFLGLIFYLRKESCGKAAALLGVLLLVTLLLVPTRDAKIYKRALSIGGEVAQAVQLEDTAGSSRMFLWKETVKVIKENYLLGVGHDNLAIVVEGSDLPYKSHNSYLEIAATIGIFGLLSYLAFLAFITRFSLDERGSMFFCMIAAYLVQGLFIHDSVMAVPLFWVILGLSFSQQLAAGDGRDSRDGEAEPVYYLQKLRKSRFFQLAVFSLIALAFLLLLALAVLLWRF